MSHTPQSPAWSEAGITPVAVVEGVMPHAGTTIVVLVGPVDDDGQALIEAQDACGHITAPAGPVPTTGEADDLLDLVAAYCLTSRTDLRVREYVPC